MSDQSLDDLLNEFDDQMKPAEPEAPETPPQTPPETPPETPSYNPEIAQLMEFRNQYEADQARKAINDTVGQMQGLNETLKDMNPDLIEGFLQTRASRDPRISQAWMNRHSNPDGFEKVLKGLSDELAGNVRPIDQKATDDHAALKAAVSEAPVQSAPSAADLNKMSDAEFAAYKASLA